MSPSRKPATSARGVGSSDRVPRRITARIEFATASKPSGADSSTARLVEPADGVAPARPIVERTTAQRREPAFEHDVVTRLDHAQCRDVAARRPGEQRAMRAVADVDPDQDTGLEGRTVGIAGRHPADGRRVAPIHRALER